MPLDWLRALLCSWFSIFLDGVNVTFGSTAWEDECHVVYSASVAGFHKKEQCNNDHEFGMNVVKVLFWWFALSILP